MLHAVPRLQGNGEVHGSTSPFPYLSIPLYFRTSTLIRVAPCDIPCRTFRSLDASRRVTVASMGQLARGPNSSERACSMASGNDADLGACAFFRPPPTVSVATCVLTSGARRNGRRAETQVEAAGKHRHLSLGRPSLPELRAAPGVGGLQPSGNEGGKGGACAAGAPGRG